MVIVRACSVCLILPLAWLRASRASVGILHLISLPLQEAVIASRQTLLKQFSQVWSDHHLQAIAAKRLAEASRIQPLRGPGRRASVLNSDARQALYRQQEACHCLKGG